jgi:hypothetical protein
MWLPQRQIAPLNPKDQNNTLIKTRINYIELFVSLSEGDGIPLTLLYHVDATSTSWAYSHIKTSQLTNFASTTSIINTSLVVS